MKKKILIFGGTGFFGKKLVSSLVTAGHHVTIFTRGQTRDEFGDKVERIKGNRSLLEDLKQISKKWDIVFDQLCFSSLDAKIVSEVLEGKVTRYILTSTGSVYDFQSPREGISETQFDNKKHKLILGDQNYFSYAEGKKQAEAYFFQKSKLPVSVIRIPIVLGKDDTSYRLRWHVRRICEEKDIFFLNLDAEISFALDEDVVAGMIFLAFGKYNNLVLNLHSGKIKLKTLVKMIEAKVGKRAIYSDRQRQDNNSPYSIPESWVLNDTLSKNYGLNQRAKLEIELNKLISLYC